MSRWCRRLTAAATCFTELRVEHRIVEFAGLLRRKGIRVSTAETIDAVEAANLSGLQRRETFKNSLRAAMIKRSGDVAAYDELFELFFSGVGELVKAAGESAASGMTPAEFQELLDDIARLLEGMDPELSDLTRALLMQDSGALEQLLRELRDSGKLPQRPGNYVPPALMRELLGAMGAGDLQEDFDRLLAAAEHGMSEEELEKLKEYLARRSRDLNELLKGMLKLDREQADHKENREQERDRLLEKSFYYLSPSEIKRMREAVSALARKLKNILAIRYKRAKRGRLDVKTTLRHSLEFGGVPFRLSYDRRRRERPQVVILCDVSDSVRNVSRFMLQFVHSLQDIYSKVRSYVFVAEIAEVTQLFKENEIQGAIQRAINGDVVNVYAHSDFGRAFKDFHRDQLEVIDGKTTVIILGDARNNYNAPNDWVLRDIRERARQVIWLNPENASTWGFGDSEMNLYSKHCDIVEECRNLKQLYKIVDILVAA